MIGAHRGVLRGVVTGVDTVRPAVVVAQERSSGHSVVHRRAPVGPVTLHVLEIAPRDVAAEALGLLLDAPIPSGLAELSLQDGRGGELSLAVLGASHAVAASRPGHRITEQVSCDAVAAGGQPLPRRASARGYTMISTMTTVSSTRLAATAGRLGDLAERGETWLCGAFPGAGHALTALTGSALPAGGWTWETWHLYPGEEIGVIVTTRSRWTP